MALQFIFGGAGSGKSTFLYDMITAEAAEHRDKQYFILVPDQFTLETQKTLVERSGGKGMEKPCCSGKYFLSRKKGWHILKKGLILLVF